MNKRLSIYIALIFLIETIIYFWSMSISDLDTVKYSLASRYSARVTLILFQGLLVWVAVFGLKRIFRLEKNRNTFILIISLITINHLIHFVFLTTNHWINDYELFTLRSAGGTFGYLILIAAPLYLKNKKVMTQQLYGVILCVFLFVDSIAFVGYVGRWNKDLPMASPKELYMGIMGGIAVILLMNVYRIFAEKKIILTSTKNIRNSI